MTFSNSPSRAPWASAAFAAALFALAGGALGQTTSRIVHLQGDVRIDGVAAKPGQSITDAGVVTGVATGGFRFGMTFLFPKK